MSEFLDELELELLAAARRRSAESPNRVGRRLGAVMRIADLRAMGSGAMMTASVGVVAVVLAVAVASGIHGPAAHRASSAGGSSPVARAGGGCGAGAATGRRGWMAVDGAPAPQLSALLRVGRRATSRERLAALSDLDRSASGARSVYARDIRVVDLGRGTRVTLLGAQACMTVGWPGGPPVSAPRPSVVAEIESVHGVATILLGSVSQIRSGAAFRARTVLLRSSRGLESLAMVPADVVRIVCHGPTTSTAAVQRFPVVDHLALLPSTAVGGECNLGYRGSTGSDA